MASRSMKSGWRFGVGGVALVIASATAQAADQPITMNAGEQKILDTLDATCVRVMDDGAPGKATLSTDASSKKTYVIYQSSKTQATNVTVKIETGTGTMDTNPCTAASAKQYVVTFDQTPTISSKALATSFNALFAAFVLAVALENAFALLFNWRLFQALLVGKAWRSPIMFVASLAVVRNFHFDLMASLFDAYHPPLADTPGSDHWLTSILTAMILAGGSAGVNRLMVALGFRSQLKPEDLQPKLDATQAWLAVEVRNANASVVTGTTVGITEVPASDSATAGVVTTYGTIDGNDHVLAGLFFPARARVPRSGGLLVSTASFYRITVTVLSTGATYDVDSVKKSLGDARVYRFGPRAIVNFSVTIP